MDDGLTAPARGRAATSLWESECKDCQAERRGRGSGKTGAERFEYSSAWASRKLDRGQSRSDRCDRHRRAHARAIQALAVPYVDLRVIGEVPDPREPTGPLGGLGPLPVVHKERTRHVELERFEFGMADEDVLRLLEGLAEKRVAIVEAGTGTGKSTFMPFRLINPPAGAALRLTDRGPIVVTEPRRAAATRVARFVGEELCFGCDSRSCDRHFGPGFPVGYQVHGERHWDAACDLIYVTDGTMINWVRDGQLARIGTVIIDEAHERSENIDIILAQLRDQIDRHEHLRVIIASATLDRQFFTAYFGGPDKVFHLSVPPKKSFGYGVPFFTDTEINQSIIRDGMALQSSSGPIVFPGWPEAGPTGPGGASEDLRALTRRLAALPRLEEIPKDQWSRRMPERVADQALAIAEATADGDILAFLPTAETIRQSAEHIQRGLARRGLDCEVFQLLSTTPRPQSDRAISPRKAGQPRKIVVSSNLAETSLTVQGVRFVVDSGLICQAEWDPRLASGSFPIKPHSQSGLRQRWGRVGRDAPGWVFPLYSSEQFLGLPVNTPPQSAQANLETFYMKLVAAGMDLDRVAAPAEFVDDIERLDDDARRYVDIFKAEAARAKNVLKSAGAIDGQGDLTAFGRELERYPGDGGRALALMLADQLACVHEVALALATLCEGRLIGPNEDCIMRWDRSWPAAWRLRAAQCHRGLAFECSDDLDVLLRVFRLWQSSDEPSAWCRRWWLNEAAMRSIWDEVMDTVDSLSAAMRAEAERAIEPALADRARAVLSRTMVSARYRRSDGDRFYPEQSADSEPEEVLLRYGRLTPAAGRVLAFHRYRRPSRGEDQPEPPLLSHVVRMLDWAELEGGDPELLGLDLIIRTAARRSEGDRDLLALSALAAFPVGLVVSCESDDGRGIGVVAGPFELPPRARPVGGDRAWSSRSGFDEDWDPSGSGLGEVPEEEAVRAIGKSVNEEANDPTPRDDRKQPASPLAFDPTVYDRVTLVEHLGAEGAPAPLRGIVAGYRAMADGRIAILIDRVAASVSSSDPARAPRVRGWQSIDCIVCGVVQDHEGDLLQFSRVDGLGQLLVEIDRSPGLDGYDEDIGRSIKKGAQLAIRVWPDPTGPPAASLLPTLREHLAQGPVETRRLREETVRVYAATIVEPANRWGKVKAELDHRDAASGIRHRFELRRQQVESGGAQADKVGDRLLLALAPERGRYRQSLKLRSEKALAIARDSHGALDLDRDAARAGRTELQPPLIAKLVEAGAPEAEAWAFYDDSLHLYVSAVFPDRPSEVVEIPVLLTSLLAMRRSRFEAEWGVELRVLSREARLTITGNDLPRVRAAAARVQALADAPRLSTPLADVQLSTRRGEAVPGVVHIWPDKIGKVLTVIAATRQSAERALREAMPARGLMIVADGLGGRIVGPQGERIKQMKALTGCETWNERGDPKWTVSGPTVEAINEFFRRALEFAPGSTFYVVERGVTQFVADPPRPSART